MTIMGELLGVTDADELAWQDDALCAQTDPEAFFPEKGGSTREAKRICGTADNPNCAVREQCLAYALANEERFGIWGGFSERERRRIARGIPQQAAHISKGGSAQPAKCGTPSGAKRHRRNGELLCTACRMAENEAGRNRYLAANRRAS